MKHEEGSLRGLLVAGVVRGLSKLGGWEHLSESK